MKVKPFKVLVWSALGVTAAVALTFWAEKSPVIFSRPLEGRPAMVRAIGPLRQVEGRLTGGFGHDVYRDSAGVILPPEVIQKIRELPKGADASPDKLADRGVLVLFEEKWDEAVASLEEAAAREPRDARISSDLAAAYLERGRRTGRSLDDFLALAAAERAVEADSSLAEALFNQALALERLGLPGRAREAWARYRELEADPAWLAEGGRHLVELKRASLPRAQLDRPALEEALSRGGLEAVREAVAPSRLSARRLGEEELLPAWARAHRAGDEDTAARSLELARALGEVLTALSHDRLLQDAVAAVEAATPDQLESLARGHLAYQEGRALHASADYSRAEARLRDAQRALEQGGSPFALRAEFAIGDSESYLSRRASAIRRFTEVAARARKPSYLSLRGESLWMEGLARSADKDIPPALAAYGRALAIFESIQETENVAGIHAMFGEVAEYEGMIEEGWQHRLAALREALAIGDPQRLFQVYIEAMMAATQMGEHRIASYFQEEALSNAGRAKNPIAIAQALFWQSRNHQRLGLVERAAEDLRGARRALADAAPSQIRDRCEADIFLAEAELTAERAPQDAIPLLDKALGLYQQGGHSANLIDILRSRALAYQALGDLPKAEEDLEFAARLIEAWRSRIAAPAERVSFLGRSEQLFDTLILLHLEARRDPSRAFDALERQRARTLLDAVDPTVQPLTAKEVAARLPAATAVVSYALLENRLTAFVIDRRGVRLAKTISENWPSVENRIAAYRAGVSGHADLGELDKLAGSLYDTLIAPLADVLPAGTHLILSCDESLQRLPFAALRNPRTRHYLVEDHTLTLAPSASVYLASVERFRGLARVAPRRVLLVSNPAVDRSRHPELAPLPWTAQEASDTAVLYPDVEQVRGRDATAETFLRKAPGFDIVHFLGHATRTSVARGSCLVLAPRPGVADSDLLCGRELEGLRLDRTRLVILSACGTADGYIARGEGIASLARSFLAAGAPAVIGTSWNVKDHTAYLFLSQLHQGLRSGTDPAAALRSTQLGYIESPELERRSPRFWANFQLTGGTR